MMTLFKSNPLFVNAIQWKGDLKLLRRSDWVNEKIKSGELMCFHGDLYLLNQNGTIMAEKGDFIVVDNNGENHIIKENTFIKTFDSFYETGFEFVEITYELSFTVKTWYGKEKALEIGSTVKLPFIMIDENKSYLSKTLFDIYQEYFEYNKLKKEFERLEKQKEES